MRVLVLFFIGLVSVSNALDTKILSPEETKNLFSLTGTSNLRLIYRASRDGFAAKSFHDKCDNVTGGTVTIMKSNLNSVFGGYTSVTWDSYSWYKNDSKAYIFSLRRNGTLNREKFRLVSNQVPAIACLSYYGPTFGGGHDIYTCDESNKNLQSYTRYCWHYECPTDMKYSNQSQAYLAGLFSNFTLDNIEVFQVISLDTKILNTDEVDILYKMTQASGLNLLYRGSRDGLSASAFHEKCDNITNTTVLIKTDKNYVFGGYVSVEWDSYSWYKYDSSAYLLSLRRNGVINTGKFKILNNVQAIACLPHYGPTFGSSYDIYISNDPSKIGGYTRFCWDYECPQYLKFGNESQKYLAGSFDGFKVVEIEVYQTLFRIPGPPKPLTTGTIFPFWIWM
jgi:hypothetical protein